MLKYPAQPHVVYPLLLPAYKGNRRVKGGVGCIDYHAFVINLPAIHRDCLEKKNS